MAVLSHYCQACVLPRSGNSWGTCVRMNSTTMDWTLTSLKTAVPLNPDASMSFDLNVQIELINWLKGRRINRWIKESINKLKILVKEGRNWGMMGQYSRRSNNWLNKLLSSLNCKNVPAFVHFSSRAKPDCGCSKVRQQRWTTQADVVNWH